MEHPDAKRGYRPLVNEDYQIVGVDGKPLAGQNDSLERKQLAMPEGVPVPMLLRNAEKDWVNEQGLRVRAASSRRATEADLEPVRTLFRHRSEASGDQANQPVGFVSNEELKRRFPEVSTAKFQEIADEEGYRGKRKFFGPLNRPTGFEFIGRRQASFDLED